jgi:hypothetical protein
MTTFKGDLSGVVRSSLRRLLASKQVVETHGLYSLSRRR